MTLRLAVRDAWSLAVCAVAGPALAEPARFAAPPIVWETVDVADGPLGELCRPTETKAGDAAPALLFIGGSEGGIAFARAGAERACGKGFVALALGYWRYGRLPDALVGIPLEYFDEAIGWLASRPEVDPGRVGMVGYSRGAEAALLVASGNRALAAVAAIVPSSYAGASVDFADFFNVRSAWSRRGEPVPFVSERTHRPGADWRAMMAAMPPPSVEGEERAYESLKASTGFAVAAIPVERIAGPVLLIAAGRDEVWASAAMADDLWARLRERRPDHVAVNLVLASSAHDAMLPSADLSPEARMAWNWLFDFFDGDMRPPS